MLPFGIKVLWFIISATGLLSCWIVLMIFAKTVDSLWGPLLYCLGTTVLEVIFCLGMIWKMDPLQMPKSFCIAQIVLLNFGSFFLTGVLVGFTMMTARTVFGMGGRQKNKIPNSTMTYHHIYLLPMVAFPIIATAVNIAIILKYDAARPADDMHCDAQPMWVRFTGYAGVPVVVAIPCLFVAGLTAWRLIQAHNIAMDSYRQYGSNAQSTGNMQSQVKSQPFSAEDPPDYQIELRPGSWQAPRDGLAQLGAHMDPEGQRRAPMSPELLARKFHMPFSAIQASQQGGARGGPPYADSKADDIYEPGSPTSSSFPTFAPPSDAPSLHSKSSTQILNAFHEHGGKSPVDELSDGDNVSSLQWARDKDVGSVSAHAKEYEVKRASALSATVKLEPNRRVRRPMPPPPALTSAIWRLIFFQASFFLVETLAALSTLIDVFAHDSKPSPFGTQHVALVLAAWGPAFVFGHTPAIRRRLMFWKRT